MKDSQNFLLLFFQIIFTIKNLNSYQGKENELISLLSNSLLIKKSPIEITNYIHSSINVSKLIKVIFKINFIETFILTFFQIILNQFRMK